VLNVNVIPLITVVLMLFFQSGLWHLVPTLASTPLSSQAAALYSTPTSWQYGALPALLGSAYRLPWSAWRLLAGEALWHTTVSAMRCAPRPAAAQGYHMRASCSRILLDGLSQRLQ
jgi:hypothetical protein